MTDILFLVLVLFLAFLYSSVGHGGASGYLALMAIFNFTPEVLRPSALLLNIMVSSIAFYLFYKRGHFRLKLLWPFIATSIPFAFVGGSISIDENIYKIILGVFLLFAVARMLFIAPKSEHIQKPIFIPLALLIGAALGFLSGLIGIGGGVILSPIIILLAWGNQKETAAVSAVFIFVNSISGFSGLFINNSVKLASEIIFMIIMAVTGGIIGSYLGSFKMQEKYLRVVLSFVLLFASVKLIFIK